MTWEIRKLNKSRCFGTNVYKYYWSIVNQDNKPEVNVQHLIKAAVHGILKQVIQASEGRAKNVTLFFVLQHLFSFYPYPFLTFLP